MYKVAHFVIFLIFYSAEAMVNPYGPTVVKDYTSCLIKIMERDFKKPGLLVFGSTDHISISVHPRISTEILKYIHGDVRYSVQVASPDYEDEICNEYEEELQVLHTDPTEVNPIADYFLLIIDNFSDFRYLVNRVIHSHYWNPRAKFIILFFEFAKSVTQVQHMEKILSCMFTFNVIDIVVIVPQEKNVRQSIIYGWRPYDPPYYCGYFNETAKDRLQIENMCDKGDLKRKKHIFENKIPKNMSGCVMHVIALEKQPYISTNKDSPNIEKMLLDTIFNKYHLKTDYEIINDTFRGERRNGHWDGALKLLTAKRGQILIGGIFPDHDFYEDFLSSAWYLSDSYTWVVPRAHRSPEWVALFIIFKKSVWCWVCLAFLVCVFVWWILSYIGGDTHYNKNLGYCFLNTWISTLGFCSYRRPKKESSRVFYVFFNFYCMLTLTGYQTKLIDVLRNPKYEYQIKTVEELVSSGLKLGGSEDLHDLFSNTTDPFDYLLEKKWINVDEISKALIDVVVHRNFSLLCSRLQLKQLSALMPELTDEYGNFNYYAFEMNTFSVPVEMVAMRGFPFMYDFSETISAYRQSGIIVAVRHYNDIFNYIRRNRLLHNLEAKKPKLDALTTEHLQGGFLALLIGYISGISVLLMEISWKTNFVQSKVFTCKNGRKQNSF